ncbi:hypothetical protein AB7W30_23010 [Providencia manganoxydans]|uniref:hypothetical protein n=1 Tax=Morganellaceae TaxID=1903414 RepID=UPI001F4E0FEF|nr:hypothetical protein [Moellerella wisconsensis]UNH44170.1 hypothetical protein MNY66_17660 [Moellerella wisconsensis]
MKYFPKSLFDFFAWCLIVIILASIAFEFFNKSFNEEKTNEVKTQQRTDKEQLEKQQKLEILAKKDKEKQDLVILANSGDQNAQLKLGIIAMDGGYTSEAIKWLSKADENGSQEAENRLVSIYYSYLMAEINQDGYGLNKYWVDYLSNAANKGNPSAKINLSNYYFKVSHQIMSKAQAWNAESISYLQKAKNLLLGVDSNEAKWGLSRINYSMFFASSRYYPDGSFSGGNKNYLEESAYLTAQLALLDYDTSNSKFSNSPPALFLEVLHFYLYGKKPSVFK